MDATTALRHFLDEQGRLKAFPAKRKLQLWAVFYLASFFEPGRTYTEDEVGDILDAHVAFHDPATLRRELYNARRLGRSANGASYWLEDPQPAPPEV